MSNIERILRMPQVEDRVGLKKSSIYNMVKAGTFPKPVKIGQSAKGWLESDVQAWIMKAAGREPSANDDQQQVA